MDKARVRLTIPDSLDAAALMGGGDAVLRAIERRSTGRIVVRGDQIALSGTPAEVELLTRVFTHLMREAASGAPLGPDDAARLMEALSEETGEIGGFADDILLTYRGKAIRPKTVGQKRYIDAIRSNTVTFCLGPAGTGKTYLAMAMAVAALKRKEVGRIILTRPVVEAGESLGFLPGTLEEKVDPYVRPLYDALFDMTDMERGNKLIEDGVIEIAPLAFMRGRTLNDSFIILDEAQNTTPEQMKMFLTRLGFGSKMVVTGDITQLDLPKGVSGLKHVRQVIEGLDGVSFCDLTGKDVVRHSLVAAIVSAYAEAEGAQSARRGARVRDAHTAEAADHDDASPNAKATCDKEAN